MKKLFKFLLSFVIVIILLLCVFIGFIIYKLSDSKDDAPRDLYSEDLTLDNQFTSIFDDRFDLENKDFIDLTLSEEEINKIIFSYIRENINANYLPNDNCKNSDCKYIKTVFVDAFIGKQKVIIKSAYVEIKDEHLSLYITLKLLGVNTRAKATINITSDDQNYYLNFNNIGLGKINVLSGIANDIFMKIVDESMINNFLSQDNISATVDFKNNNVILSKAEIGKLFKKGIFKDDNDSSAFIDLLTSPENNIINFGLFEQKLGFRFSLDKFGVNQEQLELGRITDYNEDVFIKNKVQNFIFSNLSEQRKLTFSNLEFSQLIYNKSEGYQDFITTIILPSSNSQLELKIIGIKIYFDENMEIHINVEINGLKTSMRLSGNVLNNDTDRVEIKLNDELTIGQDIGEEDSEYLKANIDLIIDVLSESLNDFGLLNYADGSFFLESDNFNELMNLDDNQTPLEVERMRIVDGFLEIDVNVSNDEINNDLDVLIDEFKNLPIDLFRPSDFIETNDGTDFINEYQNYLDNNFDNPDNLIKSINNLSIKDQNTIYNKIENIINVNELNRLYDSLFGK